MIKLNNVSKSFNSITGTTVILNKTNYEFPSTGFITLCGRSGCGKTTLFNMIAGLDQDYQGEILYDGVNIKSLNKAERTRFYTQNLFYLKSRNNFVKNITVKETLDIYLSRDSIPKALDLIEKFDLNYIKNKKIKKLSSGELKKISIIIAVCKNAKITLLDEPICNIDEASVGFFLDLIKELSNNSLVLYISHYEDDYDRYFTSILSLEDGKLSITKDTKENSPVISVSSESKFSVKKSVMLEKSKPFALYTLLRVIIIMIFSFCIYVIKLNNINVSDIYRNSLDKMSVNIVHPYKDDDVIEKKKIYSSPNKYSIHHDVYLSSYMGTTITGFGKASDFVFSDFKGNLGAYEIIVSDFFAYIYDKKVGDEITLRKENVSDENFSMNTTYVIKHLYTTNYKSLIVKDNFNCYNYDKIPDEYYYVFISDEDMDSIIHDSLYSVGGFFMTDCFVAPFNKDLVDRKYYNIVTTEGYDDIEDDEFYIGWYALISLGIKSNKGLSREELYFYGSDEYFDITFTVNDLSVTKKLKYKKYIDESEYIVVSPTLYEELKEYFSITGDNVLNYTLVDTIDSTNPKVNAYCNRLEKFTDLTFFNDGILTIEQSRISALVTFYKTNYFYIISFFVFFIALAFAKVVQVEYEYFCLLKDKNFSTRSNIFMFLCSKIIVYVIISIICLIIFNCMSAI